METPDRHDRRGRWIMDPERHSDMSEGLTQAPEPMDLDGLKTAVNEFLYRWLPERTTLGEMEALACEIHRRIEATHTEVPDGNA